MDNVIKFKRGTKQEEDVISKAMTRLELLRSMIRSNIELLEAGYFNVAMFGVLYHHRNDEEGLISYRAQFVIGVLTSILEDLSHEDFLSTFETSDVPLILSMAQTTLREDIPTSISIPFVSKVVTLVFVKVGLLWRISDIFINSKSMQQAALESALEKHGITLEQAFYGEE